MGMSSSTHFLLLVNGKLPILCEIDRSDDSLKNRYFYANNSQPVCQLEEALVPSENDPNILVAVTNKYFYLHDRLGSVRQMIKDVASEAVIEGESVTVFNSELVNTYTYNPYGEEFQSEVTENAYNPFRFTGQWYDEEISQYYLRARMYDPQLMRFTGRDPERGEFAEPLTLHRYLYCLNDTVNRTDPDGEFSTLLANAVVTGYAFYGEALNLAAYAVQSGDDRFFELSELTYKFMASSIAYSLSNPFGPMGNAIIYGTEALGDFLRPQSGLGLIESLAVDVFAWAGYWGRMGDCMDELGITNDDMMDFQDWKGIP
jgi:RHS repeat-associated protein